MCTVDRIKNLAKEHHISVYELEEQLGFGKNTIYQWTKRTPSVERVKKVADYFDVSLDYLMGRSANEKINTNKIDLAETQQGILSFEGKVIPDNELELIRKMLRNTQSDTSEDH
ncbi:helix-turn-helix domain-containing protein [Liquorilactobacillus satsumensis]|uniref:HTH cro/C1-type domain-containing protein n=1 Tax=Liquorilactobacillus satsumensis DSM 16230 = JCM 12392 TaxID=1423801 RepID=A0A0R1V8F9_9LACO|nr:helix-turn-helix transcriptional regulator [Liquorilactobacillus satsumensis]KRL99907.1 hypothetical protein FD50_GL002443 [Liquorilactobacillus satsumensis DSM 16230 = JCM 12392]MCC7665602.1 XRE family transcriptional regulator [Liquorilactobacillus satsumensis]MCP9311814.1 helix-turn-helix transcriptional regulator [Liquorilactobacillus satsumensis]MCP9328386.1 helix-turn-helix transcriptional regulator [Liquorilactobacillus satsumensis]MCP9357987.1 helix-turn-helix transcriptional regula